MSGGRGRRTRATDIVYVVIFAVIVLPILVALYLGYRDCTRQGGQYVRGLLWMECVK